jgi:hypothetical protein
LYNIFLDLEEVLERIEEEKKRVRAWGLERRRRELLLSKPRNRKSVNL